MGYRVNSKTATKFHQWATKTLKSHIIDGYTINPSRIEKHYYNHKRIHNAFDVDLLNAVQIEGVTVRSVSEKLVRLYKECEKLGIEGFGTWTAPFLNIKHKSVLDGEVPYFCSAVKGRSMAVSANGNVTTCSYTTTKIGNIDSMKFGVQSQLGQLVHSRTPGVNPFCKGCAIEGHCGGQCHSTREVAVAQGNKEILPKMCDLYRTTTSMLLEHELSKA